MNMSKTNDLPKSLHTITAIVRVARFLIAQELNAMPDGAVDRAVAILGYDLAVDPHGLAAKALAQLAR